MPEYLTTPEQNRCPRKRVRSRQVNANNKLQAINARRIIAKALWLQGPSRRVEAEALVAEIHKIVDEMGGTKFGVYQEEERSLNKDMMAELEKRV